MCATTPAQTMVNVGSLSMAPSACVTPAGQERGVMCVWKRASVPTRASHMKSVPTLVTVTRVPVHLATQVQPAVRKSTGETLLHTCVRHDLTLYSRSCKMLSQKDKILYNHFSLCPFSTLLCNISSCFLFNESCRIF